MIEFFAIIQALEHLTYYLIVNEFILHLDHETLMYIEEQQKLNSRHAKWVGYLQFFFTLLSSTS